MNDTRLSQSKEKRLLAHRLILLASAASIAFAVVAGGPSGNGVLNSLVAPVHAATDTHAPAGFADVVAKVKNRRDFGKGQSRADGSNDEHAAVPRGRCDS